jgi:hypothetical protein
MRNIDTILRHYLACAVWTGTDEHGEPLGSMGWTADDFHWDSINKARLDIERFVSLAGDLMDGISDEDIGLNFWLTRNSRFRPVPAHGPGFWDFWRLPASSGSAIPILTAAPAAFILTKPKHQGDTKTMAIVKTVNLHDFRDAFRNAGRGSNFTYEGLGVLFEYFEDLGYDLGEQMDLNVVALCCEFSEDTPEDIAERYGIDLPEREEQASLASDSTEGATATEGWMDDDDYSCEVMDAVLDHLYYNTAVCGVTESGTIVYANF